MNIFNILYIITLINLSASCLMMTETGLLRFIPTFSQAVNLCVFIALSISDTNSNDKFTKVLYVWMIYVLIQTTILSDPVERTSIILLKSLYWSSFYFITRSYLRKGYTLNDNHIQFTVGLFIILSFFTIYTQQSILSFLFNQLVGVNSIYYVVLLLPFAILIDSRYKRWIFIALIFIITLYSLKRTAILIMLAALLVCIYFDFFNRNKGATTSRIVILLLIVISAGFLLYHPSSPLANVMERFSSIEDDNGSGRETIYDEVIAMFDKLPLYSQFFGKGFCMVQEDIRGGGDGVVLSAHNDFLEILYDFGFVGIVIYISFIIKLLTRCISLLKARSVLTSSYLVSIVIFLFTSSFSHLIIYPTYFLFLSAYWAYIEHRIEMNNYRNLKQ